MGPLFTTSCGRALTLQVFRQVFKRLLNFANLSRSQFKLYSFRIGACTQNIMSGVPEQEVIRLPQIPQSLQGLRKK